MTESKRRKGARVQGTNSREDETEAWMWGNKFSNRKVSGCRRNSLAPVAEGSYGGHWSLGCKNGVREEMRGRVWDTVSRKGHTQSEETRKRVTGSDWCPDHTVWCDELKLLRRQRPYRGDWPGGLWSSYFLHTQGQNVSGRVCCPNQKQLQICEAERQLIREVWCLEDM